MKSSKKTQLLIIAVVGIFIFSVLPTAYGWSSRRTRVTIRPIEDWLQNSPFGIGVPWESAYVGDDGKGNHYWMWIDSVDGAFTETPYEYFYEYGGHVKEKVLRDGSIEITVILYVYDVYAELYRALYDENGDPIWSMNYFGNLGDVHSAGYVNYIFRMKFILDAEYDGYEPWGIPPGTREAGCALPYFEAISYIPQEMGIHLESLMLIGSGDISLFEPGWRWPAPGEPWPDPPWPDTIGTGKLFFLHKAEFDDPIGGGFGPPAWGYWPFGSSSDFSMNTIRIFNEKY
ncbi:MAG: hypothetical protein ACFE9R_21465 [Candidatus Hermodarchaeota archaeon]